MLVITNFNDFSVITQIFFIHFVFFWNYLVEIDLSNDRLTHIFVFCVFDYSEIFDLNNIIDTALVKQMKIPQERYLFFQTAIDDVLSQNVELSLPKKSSIWTSISLLAIYTILLIEIFK